MFDDCRRYDSDFTDLDKCISSTNSHSYRYVEIFCGRFFFQREGVFKAPQRQVVLVHSYCGTVEVVGRLPRLASVSLSVLVTANIHVCV